MIRKTSLHVFNARIICIRCCAARALHGFSYDSGAVLSVVTKWLYRVLRWLVRISPLIFLVSPTVLIRSVGGHPTFRLPPSLINHLNQRIFKRNILCLTKEQCFIVHLVRFHEILLWITDIRESCQTHGAVYHIPLFVQSLRTVTGQTQLHRFVVDANASFVGPVASWNCARKYNVAARSSCLLETAIPVRPAEARVSAFARA
jgi:hypothetical protein